MKASNAERQLLAALVAGRDLEVAAIVRPEHFSDTRHGELWRAGWEILDIGGRVTPVALEQALRRLGTAPDLQLDEIAMLDSPYTSERDIREAAEATRRDADLRQLVAIGAELATTAKRPEADPDRLAAEYQRRLELHDNAGGQTRLVDAMRLVATRAQRVAAGEERPQIASTGIRPLDVALRGGTRPGWQVVLGARPGQGKSALALQVARAGSELNPSLVFSGEMRADELGARNLAAMANVPLDAFDEPGRLDVLAFQQACGAAERLGVVIDDSSRDIEQVIREARRWRRRNRHGVGRIVIDYLQLYGGFRRKGDNREQEIAGMSRALKLLAMELGCTTIVLSQLNRSLESRGEQLKDETAKLEAKRPRLSDLRESGSLEQDADVVLFLFRPWVYDRSQPPGRVEALMPKFRHGRAVAKIPLAFAPKVATFGEEPPG